MGVANKFIQASKQMKYMIQGKKSNINMNILVSIKCCLQNEAVGVEGRRGRKELTLGDTIKGTEKKYEFELIIRFIKSTDRM